MDKWITRLLMGCGAAAGLMLGTGHAAESAALLTLAACAVGLARTPALSASEEG